MLDQIRTLYDYSVWANTKILTTASHLDEDAFLAESEGAKSIRDILVHTAWAQATWLERWRGGSPAKRWDADATPDIETLRRRWMKVEEATSDYLAGLRESDLEQPVSYINFAGETWTYPLWQQLVHQVNHATQHRSEVALLLTRAGHSPGDLDFLRYFDAQTVRS